MEKKMGKLCTSREEIRELEENERQRRKERQRGRGKSLVLFMPPSALVFTFFFPASCFTSAI